MDVQRPYVLQVRPLAQNTRMGAKNRVYPALPLACAIGAVMDALVLLTSLVRRNWNLGVAFLCFWNFLELATDAYIFAAWWDNGDLKLFVFCDIASHIQLVAAVVKPMATLIITRRLYLIARLKAVELVDNRMRDAMIEWTLGLVIPLVVAGPLYYVIQTSRFTVVEGFGCTSSATKSGLALLLIQVFNFAPSLVSVTVYYPRVASTFYLHGRSINEFLHSNSSISRTTYMRVLALASVDVILTLPIGLINFALTVQTTIGDGDPFYEGWAKTHADWGPVVVPFTGNGSKATLVRIYLLPFLPPLQAFFIFGLLGLTPDARASYWSAFRTVAAWLGCKRASRSERPTLDTVQFALPQLDMSQDSEGGTSTHFQGSATGTTASSQTAYSAEYADEVQVVKEKPMGVGDE